MFALPHDNALIRTAIRLGQWFHRDALPIARPIPAAAVARPALESVPYTRREDAVALLQERRKDVKLRKRVEEFLGGNIPTFLHTNKVVAVIARHICSPNYELDKFLEHVEAIDAQPILLEYRGDKFIGMNKDKYTLARMYFYKRTTPHGDVDMNSAKIVDLEHSEGVALSDINTLWGEPLVDFHHRLLRRYHPELLSNIIDTTEWIREMGHYARLYYPKLMALFMCHAIFFENFIRRDHEAVFTKNVVLPALDMLHDRFGVDPIICPIHEVEDENNQKWWTYPQDRLSTVQTSLKAVDGMCLA